MRVYTSKLTPDSVVTYLFNDCELIVLPGACVRCSTIIKVQYTLNCLRLWRVAVFYTCVYCLRD